MRSILILFAFSIMGLHGQSNLERKTALFKKELFSKKTILTPFHVKNTEKVHNTALSELIDKSKSYNAALASMLFQYFTNDKFIENIEQKQRFHRSFLYQNSAKDFAAYMVLAKQEKDIHDRLAELIKQDSNLARVIVSREGLNYFQKAFQVSEGFEAFLNIDGFRIRQAIRPNLLRKEHGCSLEENSDNVFGMFENNLSYTIVVPLIFAKKYVADITYEFYKY